MATIRAYIQQNDSILIIKTIGENNVNSTELGKFILTKDNLVMPVKTTHPGGIYTIIDDYTSYDKVLSLCLENIERVKVLHEENKKKEDERAELKRQKEEEKYQQCLTELFAQPKGWYVVTFGALVSKIKGNDGWRSFSYKVLANNGYDAYNKAIADFSQNLPSNICFVYEFENITRSLVEYVGVWTDEAEMEYEATK